MSDACRTIRSGADLGGDQSDHATKVKIGKLK